VLVSQVDNEQTFKGKDGLHLGATMVLTEGDGDCYRHNLISPDLLNIKAQNMGGEQADRLQKINPIYGTNVSL
jgi:hypothetical protein